MQYAGTYVRDKRNPLSRASQTGARRCDLPCQLAGFRYQAHHKRWHGRLRQRGFEINTWHRRIAQVPDLKQGIAGFYNESSGLWERMWGEHMHHGMQQKWSLSTLTVDHRVLPRGVCWNQDQPAGTN